MEKEVADKIYDAIIGHTDEPIEEVLPVSEQKRFIKTYLNGLTLTQKKEVARIVVDNEYRSLYKESSEGVVLDLDKLPDYVINEMYDKIKEKY